jgi:hypothetical protein
MDAPKKIDLRLKRTDAEAIASLDRFSLTATPRLFEWLRWVIVLAAITYAEQQGKSVILRMLLAVGYLFMLWYFQAFFAQYEFENFPWIRSRKIQRVLSIVLSFSMGYGIYWLIKISIDSLVAGRT